MTTEAATTEPATEIKVHEQVYEALVNAIARQDRGNIDVRKTPDNNRCIIIFRQGAVSDESARTFVNAMNDSGFTKGIKFPEVLRPNTPMHIGNGVILTVDTRHQQISLDLEIAPKVSDLGKMHAAALKRQISGSLTGLVHKSGLAEQITDQVMTAINAGLRSQTLSEKQL